jgi:hypothetical protein
MTNITKFSAIAAVGVSFHSLTTASGAPITVGTDVNIVPMPSNPFDGNALSIRVDGVHVGFLPGALAARLAEDPDTRGRSLQGHVVNTRYAPGSPNAEGSPITGFDVRVTTVGVVAEVGYVTA